MKTILSTLMAAVLLGLSPTPGSAAAPVLSDYTSYPPFLNQSVPPIVMLAMSKDHRIFIKAYNDVVDLDGDGVLDTTYKDSIDYAGYFDPFKCYTYVTANNRFEPQNAATGTNGHYCTGMWSGNFMNWAVMARIDVMRQVLYGGRRSIDTSSTTVLSRTVMPRDTHNWAKVYSGSDITSLIPYAWTNVTLCNTNTSSSQTSSLIYVVNGAYPYSASLESSSGQCALQFNAGPALNPNYTLTADVLVCVSGMLESNCETYTDTGGTSHYKPTGLMQQLGINRQGTATTTDDVIYMKFGLISGSTGAHVGGGLVRSNIVDVNSEIDPATGMVASTSQIIKNIDQFVILQYSFSSGWYDGTGSTDKCNNPEPLVLANNGICRSWGNPMGEMLYETIRFFQGKSGPTPEFKLSPTDPGTSLTTVSSWADPYATCPYCSKPFVLLLSDPFPSYDSDHLPGSYWPTSISTSDTPSVQTLVGNTTMNTLEGIGTVFMGQSGSTNDGLCTPKPGDFRSIRGLCIEEPGKQGSYYIAGLANYAKTTDLRSNQTGGQYLTTYGVVTNAPFPTFQFTVGTMNVQVIPSFHDGCPGVNWGKTPYNSGVPGYSGCASQGTNGDNSGGELTDVKVCPNDTDWTTEQGNGFTTCYDMMYDDADYGWDYDLDIRYRIYVKTGSTTITVKTKGMYGNAGHTDYAGYFINGVSGAGQYLDVVCGGIANQTDCDTFDNITSSNDGMSNSATTRTFTVTGSNAGVLKDPLWYAAKYGGFSDKDGNNVPNLQVEWDADNDGVPDTYFYAPDPLKLQNELALAFYSILNKISSGTSVSVLANSSTGDGSLYQAYFFPNQIQGTASIAWTGYVQGLFIDEFGNVREDTDGDGRLIYQNDKIIRLRYDTNLNNVVVDQFLDANGDGTADSSTPTLTVGLTEIAPIWEAGRSLALTAPSSRTILTWVDSNNNGLVDVGEQIPFITANSVTLGPYLRAAGSGTYTSTNIINFIRGTQVSGMRNRQLNVTDNSGNQALQVWKLGDPINSTPTVVRAPKERFDLLYGDSTYQAFYQKYKNRREVVYVGANDGMLHAFNGGFYNTGDDPTTTTVVEHGWFSQTASGSGSGTALGQELWAFIPYQLLPQLQWLTQTTYTHVYYVDLKPKVTDARIFTPDADHPNGWGTILIGGFRLGGSCGNCVSGSGAPPMTVNISGTNVTFYSGYFVLDITNPEVQPKLLWSYSDPNLGLTTSYPSVIRVNPSSASKTDNTNAAWLMVVGTGPTGYDGSSAQTAKILAINLATGPGTGNSLVTTFSSGDGTSFMGDVSTVDVNLDFRVDVVYMGNVICNATGAPCNGSAPPAWVGKLYRLTTGGGSPTLNTWGIASGVNRVPTVLLATFPSSGANKVGPIIAAPSITIDDANRVWLFFGTGRYFSTTDKTNADTQYFFGVKDPVATGGCTESTVTNCQKNNLLNVSSVTVCVTCTGGTNQVTGIAGVTTLTGSASTTLEGLIGTMDGWYTTLPTAGERSLAPVTLIGGTVFFTTFVPVTDVCVAAGNGYVYGLFYKTGSAYKDPVIGTYTGAGGAPTNAACSGSSTCANRAMTLGSGLPSQMVLQIGAQGTGASGSTNGAGCTSRVMGFMQSSNAALYQTCVKPALSPWSRYVSWVNQRD